MQVLITPCKEHLQFLAAEQHFGQTERPSGPLVTHRGGNWHFSAASERSHRQDPVSQRLGRHPGFVRNA